MAKNFADEVHKMNVICNIQTLRERLGDKHEEFESMWIIPVIELEALRDNLIVRYNKMIGEKKGENI